MAFDPVSYAMGAASGGGSGGASDVLVVNVSETDDDTVYIPDKTFAEASAAIKAGKVVVFRVEYMGDFLPAHSAREDVIPFTMSSIGVNESGHQMSYAQCVWIENPPPGMEGKIAVLQWLHANLTEDS